MALPEVRVRVTANTDAAVRGLDRVETQLGSVSREASSTGTNVAAMGRRLDAATSSSRRFGSGVQNASYQIADFAVQVGAGTSATRAFAQQAPQLLAGFGVAGAAAGAFAAIIGALAPTLMRARDNSAALAEELMSMPSGLDGMRSAIQRVQRVQEAYTSAINAGQGASAGLASTVVENSRREFEARRQVLEIELELMRIRGGEQQAALRNLQDQLAVRVQRAAEQTSQGISGGAFGNIDPSLREFVNVGPRSVEDVLGAGFLRQNETDMRTIRRLRAEIQLTELAIEEANAAFANGFTGEGGTTAGGTGGNGGNAFGDRIQNLQEGLMTEREVIDAWFAQNLALLQDRRALEYLTEEEHRNALLRLEEEYQRRLAGIREAGHGDALTSILNSGQQIATAIGQTNERAMRVAQAFGAAEALVNAYRAAAQALASPEVPWFAKVSAAASVLAAGIGFANSIRSISASGNGAGAAAGAASAATAAPAVSRNVAIQLTGGNMFSREQVIELINGINEAVEDGAIVRLV